MYASYKYSAVAHILTDSGFTILCTGDGGSNLQTFDTIPNNKKVCANCDRISRRNSAIQIVVDEKVEVSIADVLKAMDENGFKHVHGDWFEYDSKGTIIAGCILGQTAINLGIDNGSLVEGLDSISKGSSQLIMQYNDNGESHNWHNKHFLGYKRIAKFAHEVLANVDAKKTFTATRTIYRAKKKVGND